MKKQSLLLLIALFSATHGRQDPFTVDNNSGETIYVTVHDAGSGNIRVCTLDNYYPGAYTAYCFASMGDRNGWEIRPLYPNPNAPAAGNTCVDASQVCATGTYTGGNLYNNNSKLYVYLRRTPEAEAKNLKSSEWVSTVNAGNTKRFPQDFVQTTNDPQREIREPFKQAELNPIIAGSVYYQWGLLGTVTNQNNWSFTMPDYANGWTLGTGANVVNRSLAEVSKVDLDVVLVKSAITTFDSDAVKITFIFDAQTNTISIYNWSKSHKTCDQQYRLDLNALQKAYLNIPGNTTPTIPWTINPTFNSADSSLSFSVDIKGTLFNNDDLVQKGILVKFSPATCPADAQSK